MSLKFRARSLRHNPTDAEKRLWSFLRGRRANGLRFRRQHPIGPYVVDLFCCEKNLVVEIDGGLHFESSEDRCPDSWLALHGYRVLRFWNHEALGQTEAVVEQILKIAAES